MFQNHLQQILSLVTMEAPDSFEADEIPGKKVDGLRANQPISPEQIHDFWRPGPGRSWLHSTLDNRKPGDGDEGRVLSQPVGITNRLTAT
jgi:hypothetical protein